MKKQIKRKVLIVYPDFVENRSATKLKGSYSEGIASISAVLKQNGHDVSLFHMTEMVTKKDYIQKLKKEKPDIVAFSTWSSAYKHVKEMSIWTKEETGIFTVVGGYHATLCPEDVIGEPGIDAVCIGEGEFPLLNLCNRLDDKKKLLKTESFWFNIDGKITKNPVQPYISDLDELPMPDMELFDFDRFLSSKIKTAIVMVSRGCIFSCTYCANSQLRNVYPNPKGYARFKSPERAVTYLQDIIKRYPYIEYFNFMDSLLNMDREWFAKFIVLYTKKLSHIRFSCRLRLDFLDEETVKNLKAAGCYLVDVGIESGDPELRKKVLYRGMSDEVIEKSFSYFRKYKISTLTFNMVGLPYEDIHKTLKTVKLNARLKPNKIVVSIFYPFAHTRLKEIAQEAGFLPDDADYDSDLVCKQPQYPDKQIRYAQSYFKIYVRKFRIAYALPKFIGKPLEKWWSFCFTTRFKPFGLVVGIRKIYLRVWHGSKRILMTATPKLYIWLRNKSVKLKKKKND